MLLGHEFKLGWYFDERSQKLTLGEWYSDRLNITGGANYLLRYNLRYTITNVGPMRVTVNFYTAPGTLISGISYFLTGAHDFWEELTQSFDFYDEDPESR